MAEAIESALLKTLHENGDIADSGDFAASIGADHLAVVGTIKSLLSSEMILSQARRWCSGSSRLSRNSAHHQTPDALLAACAGH